MNHKKSAFRISIALLILTVLFCVGCNKKSGPVPAFDTPVMRFVITSDIHTRVGDDDYKSQDRLEQLYQTAYAYADSQKYNKLDGIFFLGDITNGGTIKQYTKFFDYVNANTREGTILQTLIGNHEFYATGKYSAKSMADAPIRFLEQSGDSAMDINQVIGGYHFITLGMDLYNKDSNLYFSASKINWLKEQLDAAVAEDPNKPIFVFQHEPPKDTVICSSGTSGDLGLKQLLDNYPQVINFSGHTHRPISTPRTIWQGTFTAINTGTLAYVSPPLPDNTRYVNGGPTPIDREGSWVYNDADSDRSGVLYWIMEIDKNDHIRLQIYNLETQSIWGEPYIIDSLNPEDFKYTDACRDASDKPVFAEEDALTLRGLTHQSVVINIPQAYSKDIIQDYRVELYQGDTLVNTIYRLACTFYGDAAPKTLRADFGQLDPSTDYTVKVYAVNSWAKESDPLSLSFTTLAVGADFQPDILSVSFRQDGTAINAITGEVLKTFGAPTITHDETLDKYVANFDGADDAYTYEGMHGWYKTMAQSFTLETYVYCEETPNSGSMGFASNIDIAGFGLIYTSDGELRFNCSAGSSYCATTNASVTPGQWAHAVATYDGENLKLYINGQLVGQTTATGDLFAPPTGACFFGIGADTGTSKELPERWFKGKIADVNIYSAHLTAEQVAELYKKHITN